MPTPKSKPDHDSPYKQMFRLPGMVADLLKLVAKDSQWLKQANFSSLELVSSQFLGENWKERESDVIWRFTIGEREVFLYLMLEFQSTHDWTMPVRMMNYTALLYQTLIERGHIKESSGLPPILPIVLYNGQEPWKSASSLQFQDAPEELKQYLPTFNYWLIDERAYTDQPPVVENLASALFLLETQPPNNLLDLIDLFRETFKHRQHEARVLGHWLQWNLSGRKNIQLPAYFSLTEKRDMLAAMLDKEYAQREAIGWQRGSQETQRNTLKRLLKKKFGSVPAWAEQKIEVAASDEIESWLDEVVVASTLTGVFGH